MNRAGTPAAESPAKSAYIPPPNTILAAVPAGDEKVNDKQKYAHLQGARSVAFREIEPAEELGPVHTFQKQNPALNRQDSIGKDSSTGSAARDNITSPPTQLEEKDMNAWAALDMTGENQYGVGLFIKQLFGADLHGQFEVASVLPGSAAAKNKMVRVYDRLTDVDDRSISGLSLSTVQRRIFGVPGTFVMLDFDRIADTRFKGDAWGKESTVSGSSKREVRRYPYRVTLMRGSPDYIKWTEEKAAGHDTEEARQKALLEQEVEEERRIVQELEARLVVEEGRIQQAKERDHKSKEESLKMQETIHRLQAELRLETRAEQSLQNQVSKIEEDMGGASRRMPSYGTHDGTFGYA